VSGIALLLFDLRLLASIPPPPRSRAAGRWAKTVYPAS
jgi:hypothetical protein